MTTRKRNTCPCCGSVSISRRVRSRLYVCMRCNWTGSNPITRTVACNDLRIDMDKRIERLHELHDANPGWTRRDLITFGVETKYAVGLYLQSRGSV